MESVDIKTFCKKLGDLSLAALRVRYEKFSTDHDLRGAAGEYDRQVAALAAAKADVAWALKVLAFSRAYEDQKDVLHYAANVSLLAGLVKKTAEVFSKAAADFDAHTQKALAMPRSEERCKELEVLGKEWSALPKEVGSLCKKGKELMAAHGKIAADRAILQREKDIAKLAADKRETEAWCKRVEDMVASEKAERLSECSNYAVLSRLFEEASFIRMKMECAEYVQALTAELPYAKVFELDAAIPQHTAALAKVLPEFSKQWPARLANARARADAQAAAWYEQGLTSSPKKSFELFGQAADLGNLPALYRLGVCYYDGTGTARDLPLAFSCLKRAAEGGVHEAYYYLGLCYFHGHGCERNDALAYRAFQKCTEAGTDPVTAYSSLHYLAVCLAEGRGVKADKAKAFSLFLSAAGQGFAESMYRCGLCYEKGEGVPMSEEEALRWYDSAARAGIKEAENAASSLRTVQRERAERQEAERHAREVAAAAAELDPRIQKTLSSARSEARCREIEARYKEFSAAAKEVQSLCKQGAALKKAYKELDVDRAILQKETEIEALAAEKKETEAWCKRVEDMVATKTVPLAECSNYAKLAALQKAAAEIREKFRRQAEEAERRRKEEADRLARELAAAAQALDSRIEKTLSSARSEARCKEIEKLWQEYGTTKAEVVSLSKKGASLKKAYQNLGADRAILQWENAIAKLAAEKKDTEDWCRRVEDMVGTKSADLTQCANYATLLSLHGEVMAIRARVKAREKAELDSEINSCFELARKGNTAAQFKLAEYYFNGRGVTKSYEDAFVWYQKAAKGGHKQAMERLGDCYYNGYGTEQSYSKAEKWYNKSLK